MHDSVWFVGIVPLAVFLLVVGLMGHLNPYKTTPQYDGKHHRHVPVPPERAAVPLITLTGVQRQDITRAEYQYVMLGTGNATATPCTLGDKRAKVKIRGASYRPYPYKHSYKFKLYKCVGDGSAGTEWKKDKTAPAVLNMTKEHSTNYYTLRSARDDETGLRDYLGQWIWDRLGTGSTDTMECIPITLSLNTEYLGAYTWCTSPGDKVLPAQFDTDQNDTLFKLDRDMAEEWHTRYEIKEPEPPDDFEDNRAAHEAERQRLVDVLDAFDRTELDTIDVESYARRFVLQEIAHDVDHESSVYVYWMGGKFYFGIVWDFDRAFSAPKVQCRYGPLAQPEGWEYPLRDTWLSAMVKHPEVRARINEILVDLDLKLELDRFPWDLYSPAATTVRNDWHEWMHFTCHPYLMDSALKSVATTFGAPPSYTPELSDHGGHPAFDLPASYAASVDRLGAYTKHRVAWMKDHRLNDNHRLRQRSWGPLFVWLWLLVTVGILSVAIATYQLSGSGSGDYSEVRVRI